ncbi:MAG: hypothetical protein NT062_38740 [Proteobacteria bacterium]|nr:hypothetical protein [Pseudomonadota bacterium]
MRPPLPSLFATISLSVSIFACRHENPVAPGPPIPPESEIVVGTMADECGKMIGAMERWKACPNIEEDETETLDFWIAHARNDFAASAKATPDPKAAQSIAVRCHRALDSLDAAIERCANGKRPKQ